MTVQISSSCLCTVEGSHFSQLCDVKKMLFFPKFVLSIFCFLWPAIFFVPSPPLLFDSFWSSWYSSVHEASRVYVGSEKDCMHVMWLVHLNSWSNKSSCVFDWGIAYIFFGFLSHVLCLFWSSTNLDLRLKVPLWRVN